MRPYLKNKKKKPSQKGAGRVAEGVGTEFKSQYCPPKKEKCILTQNFKGKVI
jgi:hypothetical protein